MRRPIQIAWLKHRRDFIRPTLRVLNELPRRQRETIKFNCLAANVDVERYRKFIDAYLSPSIEREVIGVPYGINYIKKVRWQCDQDCDYCIKWDEDVFIPAGALRIMLDNIHRLDDPANLLMAPTLSIGIPTVEWWAEDFLTPEEREGLYTIFLRTHLRDRWNMAFEGLNKYTEQAKAWDAEAFYKGVADIPGGGYYRGIHPVRVSLPAHEYMAEMVLRHADQFTNPDPNVRFEQSQRPYFCNSWFIIRRDTWRTIAYNEDLFRDAYEEVPIYFYRKDHGLNWLIARGVYGVHIAYQTVDDKEINKLEPTFFPKFERAISGKAFDIA